MLGSGRTTAELRERVGSGKDSLRSTRKRKGLSAQHPCCAARDVTPRAALALMRQPSLLRRGLATCVTTVKSELLYLCKQAPIQPPRSAIFSRFLPALPCLPAIVTLAPPP